MDANRLHQTLRVGLRRLRRSDGGFALSVGGAAELEPTAVAALALHDARAARWLAARQRRDGGLMELDGRPSGPATAALAALALEESEAGRRALAFAIARRGLPPPHLDRDRRAGWGWTADARALVEPTARVLIALKALAPEDAATRAEAVKLLADRRCADGGWNYGNASHLDVDLRGYAQTTAVALIALHGQPTGLVAPGLDFLRRTWRREPGALTTAQTAVAFRLHGVAAELTDAFDSLGRFSQRPSYFDQPLAVAWAVLATGPERLLQPLRGRT